VVAPIHREDGTEVVQTGVRVMEPQEEELQIFEWVAKPSMTV